MRLTETEMCGAVFLGVALLLGFSAAARADDVLSQAKAVVAAATAPASAWTGPTTGPVAATGKTVVYVAADLRNGGIQEVGDGVKQAGAKIGWTIRVLDGQGSISGIQSAFGQAMALKPNGIVIGGYDVVQCREHPAGGRPGRKDCRLAWRPEAGRDAGRACFHQYHERQR